MPSSTSALATAYSARLLALEGTRSKVETLFSRAELSVDDLEQVYAGLFITAFTEFESLLEGLFFGLVNGTHTSSVASTARRVEIVPGTLTREIVFEGRKYLDWLPLEKTHQRAKRFLNHGEPFTRLQKGDEKLIENYHFLRNAVAHKSDAARFNFEASIASLPLLATEKTPTGYLRSNPHGVGGINQFQIVMGELDRMAVLLCK